MFEHRPIAVPADPGADIVANEQCLNELIRLQMGEPCCVRAQREQPFRNRIAWGEAPRLEIVGPAKRHRQALPEPSVEAERRKVHRIDRCDELLFLVLRDNVFRLRQTRKPRSLEQIRLRSKHVRPSPIVPGPESGPLAGHATAI
jgi:hypothetical protein